MFLYCEHLVIRRLAVFHQPQFSLVCFSLWFFKGCWAPHSLCGPYGETEKPSSHRMRRCQIFVWEPQTSKSQISHPNLQQNILFFLFLSLRSLTLFPFLPPPIYGFNFYSWGVKGLRRGCGDRIGMEGDNSLSWVQGSDQHCWQWPQCCAGCCEQAVWTFFPCQWKQIWEVAVPRITISLIAAMTFVQRTTCVMLPCGWWVIRWSCSCRGNWTHTQTHTHCDYTMWLLLWKRHWKHT